MYRYEQICIDLCKLLKTLISAGSKRHPEEAFHGSTPERPQTSTVVPATEERAKRRRSLILVRAEKPSLVNKVIDFLSKRAIENLFFTYTLRRDEWRRKYPEKSITLFNLQIYKLKKDGPELKFESEPPEIFISSCKEKHEAKPIDKTRIASSLGKSKPIPIIDHHSERAFLQWIPKNICPKIQKIFSDKHEEGLNDSFIIHLNLVTGFSSCRNCAIVFGLDERSSRIANALQKIVSERLKVSNPPHITLTHRGLQHHHFTTRKSSEPTVAEFYSSDSLSSIREIE